MERRQKRVHSCASCLIRVNHPSVFCPHVSWADWEGFGKQHHHHRMRRSLIVTVHVEESCAKIRITLEHLHCPLEGTLPINTSHIQQQTPTVEKYWLQSSNKGSGVWCNKAKCKINRKPLSPWLLKDVTMVTAFNILSDINQDNRLSPP